MRTRLCVAQPPPVVEGLVLLQDGLGAGLEVGPGGVHLLGVQDHVAVLEVGVHGPEKNNRFYKGMRAC